MGSPLAFQQAELRAAQLQVSQLQLALPQMMQLRMAWRAPSDRVSGSASAVNAGERAGRSGKRHALETEWMHGVDDGSSVRGFSPSNAPSWAHMATGRA